ncbi:MAG: spore cortex-lytic enzyme [Gracilibacter sp. BRH_c7a]|nr:MAG: spore cortex-lytic enzyme [Gracilibacter sp. BRH_c7a]
MFEQKKKNQIRIMTIISVSMVICLILSAVVGAALGDRALTSGSKGSEVKELQQKLTQLGYQLGTVDGVYGKKTEDAVKRFQKNRGLKVDGVAGEKTIKELKRLTGESQTAEGKKVGYKGNDLKLLARCVYSEGRGEPFEGQVAIAAVVMNRIKSSSFPNTVAGVIYQPQAFSAVDDGQINLEPDETATKAAREALDGTDPTHGAIYYFNPDKTKNKFIWSRPQIMKLGKHIFTR